MEPYKICEHCRKFFPRPKRISDARWEARKFCAGKCRSLARYGDVNDRFWKNVSRGGVKQCWPWKASKDTAGYGVFREGSDLLKAHRYAFAWTRQLTIHDVKGKTIVHSCLTNDCCNPHHLMINDSMPRLVIRLPKRRKA